MNIRQKTRVLEILPKLSVPFDAMTVSREYSARHKERLDWHEFSYYLDELHTKGLVRITRPGGMTGYELCRDMEE